MLSDVKKSISDRQKVNAWLNYIQETDQACRDEVLELCAKDKEARAYFIRLYEIDCKH